MAIYSYTYAYICVYIVITLYAHILQYIAIHSKISIWDIWTCIFDAWTCTWMSGCVFLMPGQYFCCVWTPKGVFFQTFPKTCSWKSKMKNAVKYCVY